MKNYALLVGINIYQSDKINNLGGCKNDVANLEKHLDASFEVEKLEDSQATRKNIIKCFRNHLGQAQPDEIALFYFSGHGAQESSPSAFLPYQSDSYHETITCHDSDIEVDGKKIFDIADKEIKLLINELAVKKVKVVVIYDCCHSGSGTRTNDFEYSGIKEVIRDNTIVSNRTADDFLPGTFQNLDTKPIHLFLAACGPEEKAREDFLLGKDTLEGVFTYALTQALKQIGPHLSYTQLAYFCRTFIRVLFPTLEQTPRLEVSNGFDAETAFLDTKNHAQKRMVKIIQADDNDIWKIPIGVVHGLLFDTGKQPKFNIFEDKDLTKLVCTATTDTIDLAESILSENLSDDKKSVKFPSLNLDKTYYLVPTFLPLEKLMVYLSGVSDISKLLNDLPINIKEEVAYNLEWTTNKEVPTIYEVVAEKDGFWLLYKETKVPIIPQLIKNKIFLSPEEEVSGFTILCELLLHIAKWERTKKLNVQKSGVFKSQRNLLNLSFATPKDEWKPFKNQITLDFNPEVEISLANDGTREAKPKHKIPIRVMTINSAATNFYCYPFYLSRKFESYPLNVGKLLPGGRPRIIDEITFFIPVNTAEGKNLKQVMDYYTILYSNQELPFLNLGLPNLLKYYESLVNKMRDSGRTKDVVRRKNFDEWFIQKLTIKTLKELGTINEQPLLIADGKVSFSGHSTFSAKVGIASSATYMRGPMTDQVIKLKLNALGFELVDFSGFQKENFGEKLFYNEEAVLELHHIQAAQSLKDTTLTISLKLEDLAENCSLLALTLPPSMNGEERKKYVGTFPILGLLKPEKKGSYFLHLNQIPLNPNDGRAEPDNSLKISFVKIPSGKLGTIRSKITKDKDGNDWLNLEQ